MTLRVTIEIVPFGDESNKRTLEVINISNIGTTDLHEYTYVLEKDTYKTYVDNTPRVIHVKTDGSRVLIMKAMRKLNEVYGKE